MTDPRKYLDPKTLVKIQRLDMIARLIVEGFVSGLHRSPYHGFSVEFAEHREYTPGDDLRYLDWKVYGKSDRFYIKQYEEETNLSAYILLDSSESMRYKSDTLTKYQYGCFIAAALAYVIIKQQDTVGLGLFDNEVRSFLPPSSHASHLKHIVHALDTAETDKKTDLGGIFHTLAERIRKKGLVIIISDLFDDPEKILSGLRHFRHRKHEVILFHVMAHEERNFSFDRMTQFIGLEGYENVIVDPKSLRKAYLEEVDTFCNALRRGCRLERIDYVSIDTQTPLDVALTSYLATRADRRLS